MTGPGQPQTCSHPINARMLTRVCQAVRIFSYYFHVFVSIGTLESDLLSLSTPNGHCHTTNKYESGCKLYHKRAQMGEGYYKNATNLV